jgi:hypothetical protein
MKKLLLCYALVLMIAVTSWAQEKTKKEEARRPIQSLSWLVGGVWTADASKLGPGMQRIETRYTWSDNDAYMRFTTHFVFDKGTAKTYDGNFFWDPERKELAMWYMDSKNTIYAGPIQAAGDVLRFNFRGEDSEGKMTDLQVEVNRKTNDLYRWSLQEKDGEKWKELASLDYKRMAGSQAK